jgi:hypothetical protein
VTNVNEFHFLLSSLNQFYPLGWINFRVALNDMNALIRAGKKDVFRENIQSVINTYGQIPLAKLFVKPIKKVVFYVGRVRFKSSELMVKSMFVRVCEAIHCRFPIVELVKKVSTGVIFNGLYV